MNSRTRVLTERQARIALALRTNRISPDFIDHLKESGELEDDEKGVLNQFIGRRNLTVCEIADVLVGRDSATNRGASALLAMTASILGYLKLHGNRKLRSVSSDTVPTIERCTLSESRLAQ